MGQESIGQELGFAGERMSREIRQALPVRLAAPVQAGPESLGSGVPAERPDRPQAFRYIRKTEWSRITLKPLSTARGSALEDCGRGGGLQVGIQPKITGRFNGHRPGF